MFIILAAAPAIADSTYGFIRTVEGDANLLSGSSPEAIEATINYPIQVGDQVQTSPSSHLEVVLPDGNLLRFDGNSQLRFIRIAKSLDTHDDRNLFHLLQGQVQVSVLSDPVDKQAFRIDTANSSLFLQSSGSYRLFTDGRTWTQVIVRRGFAEVATEEGLSRVMVGQQAIIDGNPSPQVIVQAAPDLDGLERWARQLDSEGTRPEAQDPYRRGYVSETLTYAATPLYRHGRWTRIHGSPAWRPHVSTGWRPYHSGWWIYTPAGLTWISTEPWGWVTYHYGVWGHASEIGWVWYPGHRYTPGAVYWYWGPTHVGWIPAGYYAPNHRFSRYALPPYGHHWGSRDLSRNHPYATPDSDSVTLSTQVGGDLENWRDWTFSPYESFGYRDGYRHLRTGAELQDQGVFSTELPKGRMTTRTRDLTPNLWSDPRRILATLDSSEPVRGRPLGLSPLGSAALPGSQHAPPRADDRIQRDRRSTSGRLTRQWDSDSWRRDARGSSPNLRDGRESPLIRRTRDKQRGSGLYSRRPSSPGIAGRPNRSTRSVGASPRPGRVGGSTRSQGRPSSGSSGRVSGSGRSGRSTGSRPSRPGTSSSRPNGSG